MSDKQCCNRTTLHTCSELAAEGGRMPRHDLSMLTATINAEKPPTAMTCTKPPVGIWNPVTAYMKPRMMAIMNAMQENVR